MFTGATGQVSSADSPLGYTLPRYLRKSEGCRCTFVRVPDIPSGASTELMFLEVPMYAGKKLFVQIMIYSPGTHFIVLLPGIKTTIVPVTSVAQINFLVSVFAQLTYRESLRYIEACLVGSGVEAVTHRHQGHDIAVGLGRCKRIPRLAHLCRFCAAAYCSSKATLRQRGMQSRSFQYS